MALHAALLADSAAATLLAGLRLFLDTCPVCEGPLAFGKETVESCCRSVDVVAVDCGEHNA